MIDTKRQNFIIGTVGGSLVPNSTMRPQDIAVGLLAGLRTLRDEASRNLMRNLSSDVADRLAEFADEFPRVANAGGEPTDAVLEQERALVGDPAVIESLDLWATVDALVALWGGILDESGTMLDESDGFGIYLIEEDPDDV